MSSPVGSANAAETGFKGLRQGDFADFRSKVNYSEISSRQITQRKTLSLNI